MVALVVLVALAGVASALGVAPAALAEDLLPEVTGLSPAAAMVGDLDFTVTVIGSGFVQGSTVLWNGENRDTGFVSSSMLTATVRASDVGTPGTAFVTVSNPGPGGGVSPSARSFSILNPVPVVTGLSPASVWAGGTSFTLTVSGEDFTRTSTVQVAGVDLPTTFVSAEQVSAQVPAPYLAYAAEVSVRVYTPVPGGGLSEGWFLRVGDDGTAPVTTVQGFMGLWNRLPVNLTLQATDEGLGVQNTFYRLDKVGDYKSGTKVRIAAPQDHSNDGLHVLQYFSVDRVLNFEEPPKELLVGIDTRKPTTAVKAATVTRNGLLAPRYYVYDALSTRARDASLQVVDKRGKVMGSYGLGKPSTKVWHTAAGFTLSLPKGTYRMRVLAHDLAGNAQGSTKSAQLTIK